MTPLDRRVAERWLEAEPDDDVRAELALLLATDAWRERFDGQLTFGTAGLRAPIGAGPLRMNRLVVRRAAAGLVDHLLATDPRAAERGLLIGWDARRKSHDFAVDTARVAAARGMRALLFPTHVPTPVLAWNVPRLDCAAGVMVTASHNPPADNGYKVYTQFGAQIVPPDDRSIARAIDAIDPTSLELAELDHPAIVLLDDEPIDAYVSWAPSVRRRPELAMPPFAYTALHGVGGDVAVRVFGGSGCGAVHVVAAQHEPDGSFPTVAFPNPEEPGVMDAVTAQADRAGCSLAVANDPDADRLGVAVRTTDGRWRVLTGDEIGWLLADHLLANTAGDDRLVVTTLVSSSLLGKMAAAAGVDYAESFTGFKWIAAEVRARPQRRLVFAYEQALGYLVADRPLDKDGIAAALVFVELAAVAERVGGGVLGRLDEIARRFGRHRTAERSVAMEPQRARDAVERLRATAPSVVGGRRVVEVVDYPEANLLRLWLEGSNDRIRVQIRPSGTEPKVKLYGEAVEEDPTPFLDEVARLLDGSS